MCNNFWLQNFLSETLLIFFCKIVVKGNAVQNIFNFPAKRLRIYREHFFLTPLLIIKLIFTYLIERNNNKTKNEMLFCVFYFKQYIEINNKRTTLVFLLTLFISIFKIKLQLNFYKKIGACVF